MSAESGDEEGDCEERSDFEVPSSQVQRDAEIHHYICKEHLSRHFEGDHLEEQAVVLSIPPKNPYVEEVNTDPEQDVL